MHQYHEFHLQVYGAEENGYGVLYAKSTESDEDGLYCIMYNRKFRTLPPDRQLAVSSNSYQVFFV